jgi:hypothetical protein
MKLCLHFFIFTFLAIALSACGMTIEGVRYAWPVESVLEVGPTNAVEDGHHGLKFSVAKIAEEEFKDTSALKGKTIRLLQDDEGYYFISGKGFKNVYVMKSRAGELGLKKKIEVSPIGLLDPALNQRVPYVELIDGKTVVKLTIDGIVEGKK